MKCPFLAGTYMFSCTANKDVYVPSQFEFEEYCKSIRHKMCPFVFPLNSPVLSSNNTEQKAAPR